MLHRPLIALAALAAVISTPTSTSAQLPAGVTFDDGYVWYELENHEDTRDGSPFDAGWSLTARLRMFGDADRGSAFRLVLEQGGNTLAELRCGGDRHLADGDGDVPYFVQRQCQDRDMRVTATGEITVKVHFIDGDSETETLVRTHTLVVRTATHTRDGDARPAQHYVDRSAEAAASFIRMVPRSINGYVGGRRYSYNAVELVFNITTGESISSRTRGDLRCTVDGERVRADLRTTDAAC